MGCYSCGSRSGRAQPVRTTIADGRQQVYMRCSECGGSFYQGPWISQVGLAMDELPDAPLPARQAPDSRQGRLF